MKKLLFVSLILSCSTQASEFRNDVNVSVEEFTVQLRHDYDAKYSHVQLGIALSDTVDLEARVTDEEVVDHFMTRLNVTKTWDLTNRLSFSYKNYFEFQLSNVEEFEDYFRYQGRMRLDGHISNRISVYTSERFQLSHLNGILSHELEIGGNLHVNEDVGFTLFHRNITDEDFNKIDDMIGTSFCVRF